MKSSCQSSDVFDFKEEDKLPELASAKSVSKFKNPSANVVVGTEFQQNEMDDNDHNCDNALSYTPPGMEGEDPATKQMCGLDEVLLFNSTSHEQHSQFISDKLKPESSYAQLEPRASSPGSDSPGNSQLNCALQETPSTNESVDVIPEPDESMSESSPSTSDDIPGDGPLDGHGPLADHCFGGWDMQGDRHVAVVCPGYVVYRGTYYTESVLIFSSSCIELKGSTAYGKQGTFSFQLGINEIVDIESQWCERLDIAMVKLRLISQDTMQAQDVHDTSGIEELQFTIVDLNWYKKQEEILSLDVRYKALWNVVFNTDIGGDGEALPGQNSICIQRKRYFPNFDEPFEEVVYPKGDSDAVSISKRDVDLLQPDTFVNDTIIDFYIKYLKNEMKPEERHRFFFFNSFFFRKLIDLDKDPPSSFEGRAAFQRVRKWTRKVNLFEKDYVLIPVNFNYHWSLIVICHPGEVAKFQDEDVEKSLKVPCILHMDSIKGNHTGLKDFIQSYLWEEWKERQKEASEDISSKFFNLRFVPLELPQQQNSFDCGLFLLHYVERFLDEAPLNFSPFKITKFSNFLNVDWFPAAEPSLKRVHIEKLINKILEGENSPAACSGKPCASNYQANTNMIKTSVEFISERCTPLKSFHGNLSSSRVGQGIEMTLLPTSSQCAADSGLVLREFFEEGVNPGSFFDGQYRTFDRSASFGDFKGAISSMEVDAEAGGQFVYSPSNRTGFQQLAGITPGACGFSYPSRDFGADASWHPGIHQAGHEDINASPETSICASDDSLEVEVRETDIVREDLNVEEKKIDQPRSPSPENVECLTETLVSAPREMLDVADSQPSDHMLDSKTLGSAARDMLSVADSQPPDHMLDSITLVSAASEMLSVIDSQPLDHMLDSKTLASAASEMQSVADSQPPDHMLDSKTLASAASEMQSVADSQPPDHMLDSVTLVSAASEMLSVIDSQPPDHMLDSKTLVSAASEMLSVADSQPPDHMLHSKTLVSAAREMLSVADSQPPDHMLDSKTLASAASEMQSVADSQPPDHMLDSITLVSAASEMLSVADSQPPDHMLRSKTLVSAAREMLSVADSQPPDHMLDSKTLASAASEMLIVADSQPPDHMLDSKTLVSAPLSVADSQPPDHMLDSITLVSAASDMLTVTDCQPSNLMLDPKTLVSAPSEMLDVADAETSDHMVDSNGNADHLIPGLSDQGCDVQENGDITCADVSLIGDTKVSESDGQQVLEKIDDNSVSETDVQRTTKRIGDDSVSESDAQQQHEDANKIGHDSVLESDEVQPATTKRIADDLVVTQSDEMQAAKKARLTPPVEEERRQMRSLSKDLQL
ncbi:probable ubiquitin-like-specific protease 2B isoform X1 [Camellia sinensis]|uniref:probable ubiquitin-like-specific protease 2B isoform X1 n=3 Tax=Camellia sinensis TaxID=4442 RepID=UPI001035F49B|nr:probable ubiquitin-like-specific protease 2B isoform X1 [Camellia sinensis]